MYVTDDSGKTGGINKNNYPENILGADQLLSGNCIKTSSVLISSALSKKVGLFREDLKRPAGCEDWDYWLRAVELSPCRHITETLGYYRRLEQSAMRSDGSVPNNQLEDLLADMLTVIDDASSRRNVAEPIKRRAYAAAYSDSSIRRLVAGDSKGARSDLKEVRMLSGWAWLDLVLWATSFLPKPLRSALIRLRQKRKTTAAAKIEQ